jgi:predicted nucleic acid-binding protein
MREKLLDFLQELPLCYSGFEHWERVGLLRARLSEKGIQTSTPDAHIAQAAIDLDGVLLSEDKIFQKISRYSQLKLLGELE